MQQSLDSISDPPTTKTQDSAHTSMLKNFLTGNFFEPLLSDFRIIFERDPAARNWLEVVFCYPGLHALCLHRLAHWLHNRGVGFIPRFISHLGRFLTGIEIHPGAEIGQGVFIDHGMGVVIGETAIVGDFTLIYQGVTLGGTGKETGKRHPTVGKNVVIGAGAKVLGNLQIGDRVRIGAGSVVLRDIPNDCTVVGVPGRIISRNQNASLSPLEHGKLPDMEATVIRSLLSRVEQLEKQLQILREESLVTDHLSLANDIDTPVASRRVEQRTNDK
ncbi:MAG: serine O-acetyltransferase [Nostoc sp.]|uniref:serine O-acetyltransferase n=1 Tax=Nostoc sp. TaxID=1180 RepID=UPI002FF93EA2